jgi:hypothetical protein
MILRSFTPNQAGGFIPAKGKESVHQPAANEAGETCAFALPDFRLTGAQWENLNLPINVVFFCYHRLTCRPMAIYPGPNGAAEAPLTAEDWQAILAGNPGIEDLKPDVEALLIDRTGETPGNFRAPIDVCFELVRLIRQNWRGFAGGDRVWLEIEIFFARLREQTAPALGRDVPMIEVRRA